MSQGSFLRWSTRRNEGRRVGWRDSAYSRVRGPVLPKQMSASSSRLDVSLPTTQHGTTSSSVHDNLTYILFSPCYDLHLWDPVCRVIIAARICDDAIQFVSGIMRKQTHFLPTIMVIRPSTSARVPFPLHSSEGSPIPSPIDCYTVTCAIV